MHKAVDNLFPLVRIVLVETSHPGNIGAAARAMKNMGLTQLVLVNPKDFPDDKAFRRAASAVDVVSSARVVETLDEAIEGCQLVLGTSARDRRIPWPMLDPRACGEKVVAVRVDRGGGDGRFIVEVEVLGGSFGELRHPGTVVGGRRLTHVPALLALFGRAVQKKLKRAASEPA